MFLITSAAYVGPEFQIEYGKIPPSFLPIGNKRLFEHQVAAIADEFPSEDIFISLPSTYSLSKKDSVYLEKIGVHLIYADEKISLAESVKKSILTMKGCASANELIRILHGDTYLKKIPQGSNLIGIADTNYDYEWEIESASLVKEAVWCGYFAFDDVNLLIKVLGESDDDFVKAVHAYDRLSNLTRELTEGWSDFGHINTFFKNRALLTSERSFNSLKIVDGTVTKTGLPFIKIEAEANWYTNQPVNLKTYIPQLLEEGHLSSGHPFYTIEYLSLLPLNEIFVHGRNTTFFWAKIFGLCSEYLRKCAKEYERTNSHESTYEGSFNSTVDNFVWSRVDGYLNGGSSQLFDLDNVFNGNELPSLNFIITDCIHRVKSLNTVSGFVHGDFCLSNILFDSRLDRIKVVDPRGLDFKGNQTIFGDLTYDLSKLSHSVIGLYDFILAGAFDLSSTSEPTRNLYEFQIHVDSRVEKIQEVYRSFDFINSLRVSEIMPMTILLFITMLPLHSDDPGRQKALIANALRLYFTEVM